MNHSEDIRAADVWSFELFSDDAYVMSLVYNPGSLFGKGGGSVSVMSGQLGIGSVAYES